MSLFGHPVWDFLCFLALDVQFPSPGKEVLFIFGCAWSLLPMQKLSLVVVSRATLQLQGEGFILW